MVHVSTEIIIKCPIDRVSAFAADPDQATKWYENINSVQWKSPRPLQLGSLIAFEARFLGRKLIYTYEIVEYIEGKLLAMQTAEGPFPMKTTYIWESIDENNTRMTLQNQGAPTGFSKLVAPLMAGAMRKANNKDLRLLKGILEKQK